MYGFTNPNKIILRVRESVQAIGSLDPQHREQVIDAYASALRATFAITVILAIIMAILITPIKLPRLPKRK